MAELELNESSNIRKNSSGHNNTTNETTNVMAEKMDGDRGEAFITLEELVSSV
jgi:hypothetical protein